MPLAQYVLIDDIDVSPWVMQADIDVVIPTSNENWVQQADLVLSNVSGRFDGAISAPGFGDELKAQSTIVVIFYSIEYQRGSISNPNVYVTLAFTGLCQKVEAGYQTVKVQAGSYDTNASTYLKNDVHHHNGQPTGPALREVLKMFNLPEGQVSIPSGMEKREWNFFRDQSGKAVLDFLSDWDGQETFINESGQVIHLPPGVTGINPDYTGRMKMPQAAESAVAFSNKVQVRAGSYINAKNPGSELLPADAIGYETTQEDLATILNTEGGTGGAEAAANMIRDYGWLRAPTFFFPDLTTEEECRKRAIRLLARFITYWKRAVPAVVGRSPKLRSKVSYKYRRLIDFAWDLSTEFTGRVVRAKTNFGPKSGWVCFMEIQPFVLNEANSALIYQQTEAPEV